MYLKWCPSMYKCMWNADFTLCTSSKQLVFYMYILRIPYSGYFLWGTNFRIFHGQPWIFNPANNLNMFYSPCVRATWSLCEAEHGHTRVSSACTCTYVRLYVHIHMYEEESSFSGTCCCMKNKLTNNPAIQFQWSSQTFSSMKNARYMVYKYLKHFFKCWKM